MGDRSIHGLTNESKVIYTVGYEGRTIDQLTAVLRGLGVEVLVDARYRAHSRKPGFSKTRLAEALSNSGIDYQHRRDLGTPPELMRQRRDTGHYEIEAYANYLDENLEAVARAAEAVTGQVIAILCYERDPELCHRTVVADRLARLIGARIEHLM